MVILYVQTKCEYSSTSKIDSIPKKISAAIEEGKLSEKVAVKVRTQYTVYKVHTNSKRESHDTIHVIGLENFVEVDEH